MKTNPSPRGRPAAVDRPGLILLAVAFFSAAPVFAAAGAPPPEKPFVLYMGADIDVQVDEQVHRVKSLANNSFVVAINNQPVEVPVNKGAVKMKIVPQMKLTNKTAVVTKLKFERTYTPENDPNKKWARSQSGSAAQSYVGTTAGLMGSAMMGDQLAKTRTWGSLDPGASAGTVASADQSGPSPVVMQMITNYNIANHDNGIDMNSAGYVSMQLQEELDKELFDAVEVTCEVSAPKAMLDPYLLIVAEYKVKDEPGVVKKWIYAKTLDRLDEHPLKVRFKQGGLTPGFELVKQEVHLYGSGRELGTNVADQRVTFTRDEAHSYIVSSYLAAQKAATVAPTIALGITRKDFFPHFVEEHLQDEIFVKVDQAGLPRGAFRDEACSVATDDTHLESLVAQARFRPALKEGKPVDGVARLRIGSLAL